MDLAPKLKKPIFVTYYDVDYIKNVKGTNYWRNRVMKVATKLQKEEKKVYFAISNHNDMSFELGECGIDDGLGEKPVVCARDSRDRKFKMTDEFRFVSLTITDFVVLFKPFDYQYVIETKL